MVCRDPDGRRFPSVEDGTSSAICSQSGRARSGGHGLPRHSTGQEGQVQGLWQQFVSNGRTLPTGQADGQVVERSGEPSPRAGEADAGEWSFDARCGFRCREGDASEEDPRARERELRSPSTTRSTEGPQGDVSPQAEQEIPLDILKLLERSWGPRRNEFSRCWSDLVQKGRPLLCELACFHDSVLCQQVDDRFGKGSSFRLSHWNGADLETCEGVQFAKQMIRKLRPVHLWISCECGPYSPLQRINQRSEEQIARLDAKQAKARRQYMGAIEVAEEAIKLKVEVHWELSQRCEAWKLPEIVQFLDRNHMEKVSCAGCAVGLRTRDKSRLLCKAWTIATNDKVLLQHLNLPCQRNHPRGKCEAGETTHTARYTHVFAKKVVESLKESEVWVQGGARNHFICLPAGGTCSRSGCRSRGT